MFYPRGVSVSFVELDSQVLKGWWFSWAVCPVGLNITPTGWTSLSMSSRFPIYRHHQPADVSQHRRRPNRFFFYGQEWQWPKRRSFWISEILKPKPSLLMMASLGLGLSHSNFRWFEAMNSWVIMLLSSRKMPNPKPGVTSIFLPNQWSENIFERRTPSSSKFNRWRAHFWVIWSLIVPSGGNLVIRWPLCDLCMALVWLSFQNSTW